MNNKYMMLSLLEILTTEKRIIGDIRIYEDCIDHYKKIIEEKRNDGDHLTAAYWNDDLNKYEKKKEDAIRELCAVRKDLRAYFKHNGIVPTGGDF